MWQNFRLFSFMLLAVFTLAGCDEDLAKVNWSPDGQRCAVLSEHGLKLGDSTGALQHEDFPGVSIFEWLPDSKSAVLVTTKRASWQELTKSISAADLKRISTEANYIFLHRSETKLFDRYELNTDYNWGVYNLYLKTHYGKSYLSCAFHKKFAGCCNCELPAVIYTAQVYDLSTAAPLSCPVLLQTARQIETVAVSLDGKLAAISERGKKGSKLSVVSVNGATRLEVSRLATASICWSADNKALCFLGSDEGSSKDSFKALNLSKVAVAGQNGPLLPKPDNLQVLAIVGSKSSNALFCLPDGRIIFKSQERKVPGLMNETTINSSLFSLSADGKAIEKLSLSSNATENDVQAFAVNHSGTMLVATGEKGQVWLFDLKTHEATVVQKDVGETKLAPSWRTDNQFTYAVSNQSRSANGHDIEVVLRSTTDGSEQIISHDWSIKDMIFLHDKDKDDKKGNEKQKPK